MSVRCCCSEYHPTLDHDYCSDTVVQLTGSKQVSKTSREMGSNTVRIEQREKSTQTECSEELTSKGRNYTDDEIKKGSLLMYSSRKTYELLRSFSGERYPSVRTIQRHVQGFKCSYGINAEMFSLLQQKFQTMPEVERNLSIVFDEMDLQSVTGYSQHLQERLPQSKKVQVVMVRGLKSGFKEVIYYDFDQNMDIQLLSGLISQIEAVGGAVRSITLDMGNRTILSQCKVNIHLMPPFRTR